ncbi:HtaA domain-containing protein [Microbacterium aerolatum]|uniref:HtaA domain-containing protein n=2 Tax=Microbacterium aerolatum TaxID=153731 RepID=UPI00166E197F|nr:HtaA domain-containing protein [Microbacterium aerolatum]
MNHPQSAATTSRPRAAVAAVLAVLMALFGALTAPAAFAADGATVATQVTAASETGLTVQVDASGLPGDISFAYTALVVQGTDEQVVFGNPFTPVSDGAASYDLEAPVGKLDRSKTYEVVIWQQHSSLATAGAYARSIVDVSGAQWDAVFPPAPESTEPNEPTEPAEPTNPVEPTAPTEPAQPAAPAAPSLTVSKATGLNPDGETITITAENYDGSADGNYTPGKAGFYLQVGWLSEDWRPSEGAGSSARSNAYSTWVSDAAATYAPTKWTENADGTVSATWTVTVTKAELDKAKFDGARLAVFSVGAGGVTQAAAELSQTISFAPPSPTLSVSKTEGLDPDGETITITAENYDGSADGKYTPGKAGFYLQVGWLSEDWRPSEGAASSARTNAYSTWVSDAAATFAPTKWTENADGTVSATWTVTVTKAELDAKKFDGAQLAVFSVGAGGVTQAAAELSQVISFADPTPAGEPTLKVSRVSGLNPSGETLTITAENYDGSADGKYTPGKAGFYLQVGWLSEDWRPSEGAASSARTNAYSTWVSDAAATFAPTKWTENADGTVSATWTVTVTKAELDAKKFDGAQLAVFSVAAGGVTQAAAELSQAISFADSEAPVPTPTPTTPTAPAAPAAPAAGGSLRWAISSSFVNYITTTAQGEIFVSGGATRSGGQFQFGQAAGTSYNPATGLGTVSYNGSVRFTGHHGVLDVTVAQPRIEITSPSAATLYVTSGGSRVAFATLDLAAAAKTTASGAVTYTAAPATLTSAGRDRVLSGFTTSLNPVTFTIGTPAAAPNGAVGTVAAASAQPKAQLPATPPTRDGVEIDAENLEALQSGDLVTISVSGFQPYEKDVKIVVYSTPVLLGTADADANGVVTWTGTLPATLADGPHTLTFQGSINRGLEFTLDRAASAAIGQCTVDGATLNWGYKESFRNYIEGIAHGGWELDGLVYEFPEFVWSDGTGSYDDETGTGLVDFGGTIAFQGHDGALNTKVSNARIELAGDTGYIVFDITGTTQGGEAVDQKDVRFVEFSLADAANTDGVLTLSAAGTVLTDNGSAAFGTYSAGETFDPVSFTIPVGSDCGVAAPVDDEAEEGEAAVVTAAIEPISADAGFPVWGWILIGLLVVGAGVGTGVAVQRRRATASAGVSED